jgi:DNA-binding NtrC family response regulator
MAEDKELLRKFLNFYHPSISFDKKEGYSLKNLKTEEDKANALIGFLSCLSFLKRVNLCNFDPKDFALDKENHPIIKVVDFKNDFTLSFPQIFSFSKELIFNSKEIRRGKSSKRLENLREVFIKYEFEENCDLESFFVDVLSSIYEDRIKITIPDIYGIGVEWDDYNFLEAKLRSFSPKNIFYEKILKNWSIFNSYDFIKCDSNLPFPYSSLQPIFVSLFEDNGEATKLFNDLLSKGEESLKDGLLKLIESRESGVLFYGEKVDSQTKNLLFYILRKIRSKVILFVDKESPPVGKVSNIHLLYLSREGEKWYKENAKNLGFEDDESLLNYILSADFPLFSPFNPLLPAACIKKKNVTKGAPLQIYQKYLDEKDEGKKGKLLIRSLIELGQIEVAIEKIEQCQTKDDECLFLEIYAKSFIPDNSFVLQNCDKVKKIDEDDKFILKLLKARSLWISGNVEEGESELLSMLKKEKENENYLKILNQLATLYLNSGEIEKADECLKEFSQKMDEEDEKEKLLYNYLLSLRSRNKNDLKGALNFAEESLKGARGGRYHYYEALLNVEIANILRLLGRFDDARKNLRTALLQTKALRSKNLEETITFDRIILEVEEGSLLKAQKAIENLNENVKKSPIEKIIESYWLARILYLRGEFFPALMEIEKSLKNRKILSKELYLSLNILKANLLFNLNDFKSLYLLLKSLEKDEALSLGPDYFLEYYSILLLASSKKIISISKDDEETKNKIIDRCSPLSMMTYYISEALSSNSYDQIENWAIKSLKISNEYNNIFIKAFSFSLLLKIGRLPVLKEDEILQIEKFIKDNKIKGIFDSLLQLKEGKRKESSVQQSDDKLNFLSKVKNFDIRESLKQFLRYSQVSGVLIVKDDGSLFYEGDIPETFIKSNILKEINFVGEKRILDYNLFSAKSENGFWGAILSRDYDSQSVDFFKVYLELLSESKTSLKEDNVEEEFSLLDKLILGNSETIKSVKKKIVEASQFNFPVLITGEAGSGKEVCAKGVHLLSKRGKKEWVAFNCANLTPTLATSQLFGYKKGAFTGADSDREGLVSAAKDSTLFLDEIGELPFETQSHFLRFLQDGTFQPLGSNITLNSNARIIAATNRNLEEEVEKGNFREDLYYRLKVLTIEVPPLRDRKEDIPAIFEKFLKEECEKEKINEPLVEKGVILKLLSHPFYGNVRELQNLTKRLIVSSLKSGRIDERNIEFDKFVEIKENMPLDEKLKKYERELILDILKRNSFNIKESARESGLSRQAFYQRAKRLGVLK